MSAAAPPITAAAFPVGVSHPGGILVPRDATRLIGREQEVREARRLLRRDDVRLLVLTGAPGVGKTRVARRLAVTLHCDFAGGIFLTNLESVHDPALALSAVAASLGARETDRRSLPEVIAQELRARTGAVLLVLDNFEHLLPAGPALTALLAAAPDTKALVTSRTALSVYGEWELVVPPLAVPPRPAPGRSGPTGKGLERSPAVQLFVERAKAKRPDFALTADNAAAVAEICRQLDGIPLAIELAAAVTRLMAPDALLRRWGRRLPSLTGGPSDQAARHQTMAAAVAWSYDLLDEREAVLFRRLAVFAGGHSLDAVEKVCTGGRTADAGPPSALMQSDLLAAVAALVDKNLLQREDPKDVRQAAQIGGEPRFRMLEIIREFAAERLAASGEDDEVRDRHAALFLILAERADAESLVAPERAHELLAELDREHANLLEALRWLGRRAETGEALRLADALGWYWSVRGHLTEGRQHLVTVLAVSGAAAPAPLRAKALARVAALAAAQGDDRTAQSLYDESLALWRSLGNLRGAAGALLGLGNVALEQRNLEAASSRFHDGLDAARSAGDLRNVAAFLERLGSTARYQGDRAAARRLLQESLALRRGLRDRRGMAWSLEGMGWLARDERDLETAHRLWAECLAIRRELGDQRGIANALSGLAWITAEQGDHVEANALLEESIALKRSLGDTRGIVWSLGTLAHIALKQGDHAAARQRLEERLVLARELGDARGTASSLALLAHEALQTYTHGAARLYLRESTALRRNTDDPHILAQSLVLHARLTAAEGDPTWALRLVGAAEALCARSGRPLPEPSHDDLQYVLETARRQLGRVAQSAALAEGRAMTLEQALAYALGEDTYGAPAPASHEDEHRSPPRLQESYPAGLTEREVELLRVLAAHPEWSNRQAAQSLFVETGTVRSHLDHIYAKLDAHSRYEAIVKARDAGLAL
ncbi:MAG TPA: tetratricopeptide repeat protein [Chloroflexota bacterium]|nr:tetratricopeptide repeat protein [Chloroflexota bacterium]